VKKALVIIGIFLSFLIVYFFQVNFFSWFTIGGIKPNIFVLFVLFVNLFAGRKVGISFGVFIGLFLDIVLGRNFGTYTIMLTIISIFAQYLDNNFSKDSRLTIMLMVIITTIFFEIGCYILNIVFLKINIELLKFIKVLIIETIYNAIITIIIYPVMQKIGYNTEEIFKEQKILTRYF
jgi:rod shape-determining protein MreD